MDQMYRNAQIPSIMGKDHKLRAPMKIAQFVCVISCMSVGACGTHNTTVNGSVFVVTKGGNNVKLGLVRVSAFVEKTIVDHVKARQAAALDSKREDQIQQKINAKAYKPGDSEATYKSEDYHAALDEMSAFQEQKELLGQHPAAFIFSSLPEPIATATTDADGKFSMTIQTDGDIILVAQSSREIGQDVEKYYWFCRVSRDGAQPKAVILSNQNMLNDTSALMIPIGIIPPAGEG